MNNNLSEIRIEYPEGFQSEQIRIDFEDFKSKGLIADIQVLRPQVFASFEWIMPTLVVGFVFKSYFDGFLKEAGKDHYQLLSSSLKKLARHGKENSAIRKGSTPHKVNT